MKKLIQQVYMAGLVLACTALLGCETAPTQAPAPNKPVGRQKEIIITPPLQPLDTTPAPPPVSPDVQAMKDGMALYDAGDYNGALKRLGSLDIWNGHNKDLQVNALKFMAFSYCVTSRVQLCRQQFDRALKLDPTFNLSPGEIGHPIWGPVFLKSKNAIQKK
ncbi:TssQ family T6SS-associated lipoprotein [Undibacterium sp. Di26W]|uniref:TssQ family T6SS-associated lipoprotein n=1 Tax=Undibacterium sp. Di26W TaxID=3413035 RepID=UPI003BF03FC1